MNIINTGGRENRSMEFDIETILSNLHLLKEEKRMAIIDMLHDSGTKGLSFTAISKRCAIKPTVAAYHLKLLTRSGLLKKGFPDRMRGREHTSYSLTEKGKAVWSLKDILEMGAVEEIDNASPDNISMIPMEYGPRIITLTEVK